MFIWCIVTDLSLVSSSPHDDDLSLYVILKAFSWIRFILLLSPLLWNIHSRGQYPNFDSINYFIIIRFLLTFIKGAIRRLSFLHKWLTWSSNFSSWLTVISRRTSVLLQSMEKPSIIAVVASAHLIMRWILWLFAFMKLLLNNPKSSDEDVPSALMTDYFFFVYHINCSIIRTACNA